MYDRRCNMQKITLIAIFTFGLEAIVRRELEALGFTDVYVTNGQVEFEATLADIARVNIWLRCADRVLLKMGVFEATTFDTLFEGTKALPWETIITEDGQFTVNSKSVKSVLRSSRSCQAIVKKAIVERLKERYKRSWFEETGPAFTVQVSLLKDTAVLTLDTSGSGLHKRGYRLTAGEAPIKETLAAALVQLTFWRPNRLLLDPMCGSGTILIEAALIARNIAPGLKRPFAAEGWPLLEPHIWQDERAAAQEAIQPSSNLQIRGYDIDAASIEASQANAHLAGVSNDISFTQKDIHNLWIDQQYGIVITNPPYGQRLANFQQLNQIYITLNKMFKKKKGWSLYILTADKKFPNYFKRARPDRIRKLYNGSLEVNYYQYYGQKPPTRRGVSPNDH